MKEEIIVSMLGLKTNQITAGKGACSIGNPRSDHSEEDQRRRDIDA